jgi:hypothetical protein
LRSRKGPIAKHTVAPFDHDAAAHIDATLDRLRRDSANFVATGLQHASL